jgi:type VI protein secretion system component VasK
MSFLQPFFAQDILPTDVIPGAWRWMGLTVKELLLLLGAVGAVTLLVVLWAIYLRKRPRQHSHRHHHHHPQTQSATKPARSVENGESDPAEGKTYRRKRRRRREHRPRNPTLAETGGLPPLRTERPNDPIP